MDREILKQLRKVLVLESFFSGASSLSKVFNETEDELDDMMEIIDKKVKGQKILDSKFFKGGKF